MNNTIPDHAHTKNLPGVPILPGRNTPMIQSGSPKNVPAPGSAGVPPAPANSQKQTKETK